MLIWMELALTVVAVLLAGACAKYEIRWLARAETVFASVAARKRASVLLVGVLALAARAALLPALPQPEPSINDEFSHLLLADTVAHGRLANPPHPMWIHFETFHVIQQPSYASMYPPAQGLILALGQFLTGNPFVGVCLSVALFCAALCWMLQAWTTPGMALLGGLLAVLRFGLFSYWANGYWGGAMAALGGALVLGALPRIRKTQRPLDAIVMGVGLAILANSRPFEGFVLSVPVGAILIFWLAGKWRENGGLLLKNVILPLVLVLGIAGGATGYYFWKVTGSPLRMPQMVDRDTYAVAPYFLWQSPRPEPVYHHEGMRQFYLHNELDFYRDNRSPLSFAALTIVKLFEIWLFYLGPVLTLPLLVAAIQYKRGARWASLDWETRALWTIFAVWFAGLALEVFFFPHYAAPIASLLWALAFRALYQVRKFTWNGKAAGVFLTRAVPAICLALVVIRLGVGSPTVEALAWPPTWYNGKPPVTRRAAVLRELQGRPGMQLAIVRYANPSKAKYEWVYNRADIDGAKVVWARDMGCSANRELLEYFQGRTVWLVEPDRPGQELEPYPCQ